MSWNTFGRVLRFTTWGESHGPALGAVVDGCPPGLTISEEYIQPFMDARKPGTSRFTTQRREDDLVRILSGTFEGKTTGTPISLMIENTDQRSKDYSDIAQQYRPGHADYAYDAKYGIRDYRGGGRSSARETAMRVAAGAVARKVLGDGVRIRAGVIQLGPHRIAPEAVDFDAVYGNALFAASAAVVPAWEDYLDGVRKAGSSIGAVVALEVTGLPAGLGRAGLWQAGRRTGGGDDVDQCGQGRRYRRGFRGGRTDRRTERRPECGRAPTAGPICLPATTPAGRAGRHFDRRSPSCAALTAVKPRSLRA